MFNTANLAPTKTNLLKLKGELKFAKLGYELLDQKRNILVIELLNLIDQAEDFEKKVNESLDTAWSFMEEAVLSMGRLKLKNLSGAINIEAQMKIKYRKVMGVELPVVDTNFKEYGPYYSIMGTSFHVDSTVDSFREALKAMGKLAELKVSIMRLAFEVKKTIRKVNALEKVAIPGLEKTYTFIQNRLEENERDMFVLMKMVKGRLESKALAKNINSGE
jgi:V/A-type H+-transporting ATPase subunit D